MMKPKMKNVKIKLWRLIKNAEICIKNNGLIALDMHAS
jgi:hypothetical protein